MVPDLTLEVIYLDQPTDFKMEFELCSSSNIRFLSAPVKTHGEFLNVISKSVIRSRAIVTVGSFNPLDKLYIPKIIAKATGYKLKEVDKEKFGIELNEAILLPESSLPLVDEKGNLGGCVLESNDQAIIMLTSDRALRHSIVTNLVCPYLKLFANKSSKTLNGVLSAVTSGVENADSQLEMLPEQPLPEINETVDVASSSALDESLEQLNEVMLEAKVEEQSVEENTAQPTEPQQTSEAVSVKTEAPQYAILEQPETDVTASFSLEGFLLDDEKPKPKRRKTLIKIIISIILVAVVLLCSYFGHVHFYQPMQCDSVYAETRNLYGQGSKELPEDMLYKFGKLYQINSDIYGWLTVPNTNINLPVVSAASKSSGYYRSHLFEGSVNRYGTLYTPSRIIKDGYHRNIIIYGKNTGDGVMLSELDRFLDVEQYKATPTFTFDTLYIENTWKIFSAFKIDKDEERKFLDAKFSDDAEFSDYLKLLQTSSVIDTNIDVTYSDQIVTLVAQGDKANVILAARRVRDGETPLVDVTGATENYTDNGSSDIPVAVNPLEPIEDSLTDTGSEFVDSNMLDGASSRYEQQAPVASTAPVKPTIPTISSLPELSSVVSNSSVASASSKASSKSSSVLATSSSKISSSSSKTSSTSTSNSSSKPDTEVILTVTNTLTGKSVTGNAVDIVAQNIEAEMGSGYQLEALKAQAVAAYSWLLNNGSASGKAPRLPLKTPSAKCLNAAKAVAGQVAVYNGSVATTYYFAISAGRTANSEDIWSSSVPYCKSVDSSVDESVSGFKTVRRYSADTVAKIAKSLLKENLEDIEDKSKWFSCTYDSNGLYCSKIKIGSITKKGTYMRDTFFNASRVGSSNVLRSSAYTISYDEEKDEFVFTVKGYGHGVGMSQTGANAYAKKGWTYEKILKHYYTGISLGIY